MEFIVYNTCQQETEEFGSSKSVFFLSPQYFCLFQSVDERC